MAEKPGEPAFRIHWEGLDMTTVGATAWSVRSEYLGVSDVWWADIVVSRESRVRARDLYLCPVTLALDGATLLQGRCEWVETGATARSFRVGGRDYLCDLLECDTDPALIVSEGDTLQSAILKACGPVGITSLVADGGMALRTLRCGTPIGRKKTRIVPGEVKMQDLKPAPGRKLAEWVSHLATRHGMTIQPGSSRDQIQLHAPDYEQEPIGSLQRTVQRGTLRNLTQARSRRDGSRCPTCVLMTNQAAAGAEAREAGLVIKDVVSLASENLGDEVTGLHTHGVGTRRKPGNPGALADGQFYRLLYHQDKEARNADMLLQDVRRTIAERLRATLQYEATVRGFRDPNNSAFYATDTMLTVMDDVADVNEVLWVSGREFSSNGHSGPTTRLHLWRPGSFVIA